MKLISSDVVTIFVLVEGRDDEAVRLWGHLMANIGPCKSFSGHIREPILGILLPQTSRCHACPMCFCNFLSDLPIIDSFRVDFL